MSISVHRRSRPIAPQRLLALTEPEALAVLAALAQETRLRLVRRLLQNEPQGMTPGELIEAMGLAPATLSFHLKELEQAGLAASERHGRHLIYRADVARVQGLLQYLTQECCAGQSCELGAAAVLDCGD